MPKKNRGVRKFFSKPRKGYRTYGSHKVARSSCYQEREPEKQLVGVRHSEPEEGCLGFDASPLTIRSPIAYQSSKRGFRVLSLFDGISSGYHILHSMLGLRLDKYWSSEIDHLALRVQKHNFGDNVIAVGCVKELDNNALQNFGQVDLLIGGSPCSDISLVNWRRKGLHDGSGSGILFFEFVRVLKYFQEKSRQRGSSFYWLFENTAALEAKTLQVMSSHLGCHPVRRCAQHYVPMVRRRNYWGNIPGMYDVRDLPPTAQKLQDYLKPHRSAAVSHVPTLTSSISSQRCGRNNLPPLIYEGKEEFLSVPEMECLFGYPAHYTDCDNLSPSQRRKLIGKSWCTPVVADMLKPLQAISKLQIGVDRCQKHDFVNCYNPLCFSNE